MPPQADHLILHETDEAENHTAVFIYSEPSDSSKHSPARVDISVRQHLSFVFRLSNMHCPRLRSRAGSYRCHFFPGLSFMDPPSDLVGCGSSGSSRSSRNGMSTSLGYLLTSNSSSRSGLLHCTALLCSAVNVAATLVSRHRMN
jgi:hypothetical protein